MARVNQGYYNEIIKEYESLIKLISNYYDEYVDEEYGDREMYWDAIDNFNHYYVSCTKLKLKLENLLKSQKFEQDVVEEKYSSYLDNLNSLIADLVDDYSRFRSLLGNEFSDAEIYSLKHHVIKYR